jgi:hypothetical protein
MPDPQEQLERTGGLTAPMLDLVDQLVDGILGKQTRAERRPGSGGSGEPASTEPARG